MNNFDPKITLIQKLSMNIIQYPIIKPDISSIFRNLSSQSECETSFKKKKTPQNGSVWHPEWDHNLGPPSWRLKAFPPLIKAAWPSRP